MRKKKLFKQSLASLLALSCLSLTGCGSFVSDDVTKYELVSQLTLQEVRDYYAKALEYDSIVTRAADDNKAVITYNVNPVSPNKEDRLKRLVSKAEQLISSNEYSYENDNADIISEDTWIYIKSVLDNEVLSNGSIVDIGGALGFYFVDVQYDISATTPGKFKPYADMLGLNGVWMETATGDFRADVGYLEYTMQAMNKYFADNNIMKCAYYDESTLLFQIIDGLDPRTYLTETTTTSGGSGLFSSIENTPEDSTESETGEGDTPENPDETTENPDNAAENPDGTESPEETENTDGEITDNNTQAEDNQTEEPETVDAPNRELPEVQPGENVQSTIISYESLTEESRRPVLDSELINSVAGSSMNAMAFLPYLDLVYEPSSSGGISGLGIYPQANSGLRLFGYDRSKLAGKITLRYVFKDDIEATGKFIGTNIYVLSEEITTGTNVSGETLVIPEYLMQEFKNIIERADRVQANVDIAGMLNGKIYEDKGVAVLAAFKNQGTHTGKYMSTIRQVLNRDMENNAYLLEVETTLIEGPRSSDCYGTYKDKAYVVIQQQGNKFVISDYARGSRTMVSEPPIDPDKAIEKRLVALNLAGEVEDTEKDACTKLMSEMYTACVNKIMNTQEVNGEMMRGINDCFNSNTEMLSSDSKAYSISLIQNRLAMYGAKTESVISGNITDFIGGWDNQVEFMTEELITYAGRNEGYYMNTYYLVSSMEDVWVIDERTVIDERIVEGAELQQLKERLGQ